MAPRIGTLVVIALMSLRAVAADAPGQAPATVPTDNLARQIAASVPDQPTVRPARPRKLLVIGRNDTHPPVAAAAMMLEIMARKTGAFSATFSDGKDLTPEDLRKYDAFVINNLHGYDPFDGPKKAELQNWLRECVGTGRGLVGLHAATLAWMDWKDYGDMIGAYYFDWPWKGQEKVTIKLDDPDHPVNAAFGGKEFAIADEIYQFREPYSRDKLHILASLDMDKSPRHGTRKDNDYAVSWVNGYGYGGRVFYTVLGHNNETYCNPVFVQHVLDGIQFAIGDLPGETVPTARLEAMRGNVPKKATAKPLAQRKLLIYGYPSGGQHEMGIRGVLLSLEMIGKQTGAWETVASSEGAILTTEKLKAFDAVVLNNCGNNLPNCDPAVAQQALLEYVQSGKGLMAFHTTAVLPGWNLKELPDKEPEKSFREMIGACFASHPFATPATLRVEDPLGSLSGGFGGKSSWRIAFFDEIYSFREPYSRSKLRVLLSVETAGLPRIDPKAERPDGDYAIAWIKCCGKGRVFYSALGHGVEVYTDGQYLRFIADAAQFVLGDLPADTTPIPLATRKNEPGK